MGAGKRAKPAGACLLVSAFLVAGCGAQEHANDPRPPSPAEVTASISQKAVSVQPGAIGVGNAAGEQALAQNAGQKQPQISSSTPMTVAFTIANLTNFRTQLEIQGPVHKTSPPLLAQGTANFRASLPTGNYTITAADIPAATAAHFKVGPKRTSSANDLLLP